ncbi:uncharacterized protein AKAW2_50183A [Aspergillus luchuensis]|uniref:Uncharacterized protein n=1 Tax=Aspergillus kawachii TaxID=1069201 RepID=A0A7R7WBE1_ASPKA|nr:uncharacterized protein AKAW2_50183A [Aspergillus luchuensis]BCR99841.1 hypothetical protein AKAW2_50183A [Aspergillus luchuensis]
MTFFSANHQMEHGPGFTRSGPGKESRDLTNDAASSIYSRELQVPPVPPLSIPRKGRTPTDSPARHDLPEINLIDHQIALARGTTMALETTRVRLRNAKKNGTR